jgi:hypothetical protein
MNTGSTGSNRKTLSQNTKAKISQAVKNAYARNETRARSLGMNVKTLRKIKKAHEEVMKEVRAAAKTKKASAKAPSKPAGKSKKNTKAPVAPNFNPFNIMNNISAPAPGTPNPFNQFNAVPAMPMPATLTKKGKATISNANKAKRNKMSASQKASTKSQQWLNNVKRVQNTLGVSRQEAMVIAKTKREEKAGSKKNANINLLGLSSAPVSVTPAAKKYNENIMAAYGM